MLPATLTPPALPLKAQGRVRRTLTFLLTLVMLTAAMSAPAVAQDDEDTNPIQPIFAGGKKPFVVVTASSANQLKEKASFMFEAAGYPDAVDMVLNQLDNTVNGLSGLNWDRPIGMMIFLDAIVPPSLEFVVFAPMSSKEQFQSMMELGPVIMREDGDGRFTLVGPNRDISIRTENGYAFIQLPIMEPDTAFERELPAPATLTAQLTTQFDVGVTLDVEAVPKVTRDLLLNFMTATMSTQIQQRDGESDGTYQMRKSWMQADIDAIKLMLNEMQRVSLGVRMDNEGETPGAHIDMVMQVREGTKLLEAMMASSTKASYFTPLLSEESPVSLSYSGVMAEWDIERYFGVLEGFKGEIGRIVEEEDLGVAPAEGGPLMNALNAMQATVQEGHLDTFAQLYRDSDEKLALVTAMRVVEGETLAVGLRDMLMRIQDKADIGEMTLGAAEHQSISFHRMEFKEPNAGVKEMFGNKPQVNFGIGDRSIWMSVGGEESFSTLTGVMDELVEAYENPKPREIPASMRLVIHTTDLVEMVQNAEQASRKERAEQRNLDGEEAQNPRGGDASAQLQRFQERREARQKRNQEFLETLAEGGDRLVIEARPVDNGARMRVRFEMGFVKALGRAIGQAVTR